jgi:hypothetical protein
MAIGTEELESLRDALIRARARGTRSVEYDGKKVDYTSDAEMAAAINDLEARIRRASTPRGGSVSFATSKGM